MNLSDAPRLSSSNRPANGCDAATPDLFGARNVRPRRLIFFACVLLTIAWGIGTMFTILSANGTTVMEGLILVLFSLTFAWIAVSFWTGVAGFIVKLFRRDPTTLRPREEINAEELDTELVTRTAVVMPIYNEDPDRVFAGLEATYRSLADTGEARHFDIYILSDTRDPAIAENEEAGWAALCHRLDANGRIFYRRRPDNTGRKAGNIADFCRKWGRRYEGMIVLDADSVVAGKTLVALARALQATPQAGIIQTVPLPARQTTLFGRFVQFAARLYSPMLASGLAFWQLGEANYWGHNAIIRVSAFTQHCGLPVLPGAPPLGGEILSHDFVEAALLRRGRWKVFLLPEIEGSYEEVPNNILDFAKRDRRWAQGNIQHLKLLTLKDLHPLSRLHFSLGALAYGSSLIWLLLLVLSTFDALERAIQPTDFFGLGPQLFPDWTIVDEKQILSLIAVTTAMLLLPKILGVIALRLDRRLWNLFGGFRVVVSAVIEIIFSIILAPLMMTLHAYFVTSILAGRNVSWDPQNRGADGLTFASSVRALWVPTVLGIVWGSVTYALSPFFFWWLSPVIFGLVVAIPLCAWSSRREAGRCLRRLGLLLTPEENAPPTELRLVSEALLRNAKEGQKGRPIYLPMRFPLVVPRDMDPQPLHRWSPFANRKRARYQPSYRR